MWLKSVNIFKNLEMFVFVRHGETPNSEQGLLTGSQDPDLTLNGKRQAEAAGLLIERLDLTEAICSPALRCRSTARFILEKKNIPLTIKESLRERKWGDLEGMPREYRAKRRDASGVESYNDFKDRVLGCINEMEGRPLLVSHSGVFRVLAEIVIPNFGKSISPGEVVIFQKYDGKSWIIDD